MAEYDRQDAAPENSSFAWLSEVLQTSSHLIFRRADKDPADRWYYGLTYFEGSACIVWPGTLKTFPDNKEMVFEFDMSITEIEFHTVLDMTDLSQACSVVWKSPLWQKRHLPAHYVKKHALRLVVVSGPEPLRMTMAKEAYFNLKMTYLAPYAEDELRLDLPVECAGNRCNTIFHLCKTTLGLTDEATMAIVAKCFGSHDEAMIWMEQCLEMDECLEVLDMADIRKITKSNIIVFRSWKR